MRTRTNSRFWSELRTRTFFKNFWSQLRTRTNSRSWSELRTRTNSRFWSDFLKNLLIKFSSKIFKFYVEIEDWNFENRRRWSFQKFQKNDFQKIFKTQYPMKKCLFLIPFFQLTILNFRLGSLRIFEKVPITKSKMYFLGVWRKKIFYEFRWVFEKVHIEFFILGLVEKMEKFWKGFE